MNEIWIVCYSVRDWTSGVVWEGFLEEVQGVLGVRLSHLDVNDPVKKKVIQGRSGSYIASLKSDYDDRWVFGIFGDTGIAMEVCIQRSMKSFPNTMRLSIPAERVVQIGSDSLCRLLEIMMVRLGSFYGLT